jgi:hypothetical protein
MEKTKHQKYSIETVLRSAIKPHPKNPRVIHDGAKKKLKDKMAEVGLLQPLIVNKTTGYLLGGHQRLASLDSLERYRPGHNDYKLDVAIVELDLKQEADMLVFLNNPSSMGRWDSDMLAELTSVTEFGSMGFDQVDVEILFGGDSRFATAFEDVGEAKETKGNLEEIKEARKQIAPKKQAENSVDYYVTIVCKDANEKAALMKHLGIPKGEIYISPHEIMSLVKA